MAREKQREDARCALNVPQDMPQWAQIVCMILSLLTGLVGFATAYLAWFRK